MRHCNSTTPSASSIELQARLRYIEDRCDKLQAASAQSDTPNEVVVELAYLAGYLAKILRKHLQDNEV